MTRFNSTSKRPMRFLAFALTALLGGCGGGGDDAPVVPPVVPPVVVQPNPGGVCTAGAACVDLGAAGTYVILAQSGVTNVATSAVAGNIGVSPVTSTAITGFGGPVVDASGTFSTSAQVTGRIYAADYAAPTPTDLTTAVNASIAAYNDAAGRPAGAGATNFERGAGTLTNDTLVAGTYTWTTTLNIPTDLTLSGSATDVWILQIGGNLIQAAATRVNLTGGALSKNVFWQVGGGAGATIGSTAHFAGIIITGTAVTMGAGATADGRFYTATAVTLDQNTVTRPAP